MFEQNQYDAWAAELSNYFVSKLNYQMVRVSQNRQEFWLVNQKSSNSAIIMISSAPTDSFNQGSIAHDRQALSGVFTVSPEGLNISVNQESIFTDESTVIIGPGMTSVSSKLSEFKGLEKVLAPSDNPGKSLTSAFRSMQRATMKNQKIMRRKAFPVTTIISALTVVIFFIGYFLQLNGHSAQSAALMLGAFYKPLVVQGNEYFRLITAGFVHIDFFHLLINLMAFRNLGVMMEPVLGKVRYFLVLLAGILFGNIFVFIVDGGVIGLGLSGGLFALMGALIVYLFETQAIRNPRIRGQVISTLLINLMISILPNVSMMAHLGGFQAGIFLGFIFSKRKDWAEVRKIGSFMFFIFTLFLCLLMVKNAYAEPNILAIADYINSWDRVGFDWYARRLFSIFF